MAEASSSTPWLWISIGIGATMAVGATMVFNSMNPCRGGVENVDEYEWYRWNDDAILQEYGLGFEEKCTDTTVFLRAPYSDGSSWKLGADNDCGNESLTVTSSNEEHDEDGYHYILYTFTYYGKETGECTFQAEYSNDETGVSSDVFSFDITYDK